MRCKRLIFIKSLTTIESIHGFYKDRRMELATVRYGRIVGASFKDRFRFRSHLVDILPARQTVQLRSHPTDSAGFRWNQRIAFVPVMDGRVGDHDVSHPRHSRRRPIRLTVFSCTVYHWKIKKYVMKGGEGSLVLSGGSLRSINLADCHTWGEIEVSEPSRYQTILFILFISIILEDQFFLIFSHSLVRVYYQFFGILYRNPKRLYQHIMKPVIYQHIGLWKRVMDSGRCLFVNRTVRSSDTDRWTQDSAISKHLYKGSRMSVQFTETLPPHQWNKQSLLHSPLLIGKSNC